MVLSDRQITVWNTSTSKPICEISFRESIEALKLNTERMVVCTKDKFYIYDVAKMKLLHSLDTTAHLKARFCLSPRYTSSCYLAYSDEAGEGIVSLYDVKYLLPIDKIKAHKSSVTKMSISQCGTILVTSSGKGTLFRVFHLPEGG